MRSLSLETSLSLSCCLARARASRSRLLSPACPRPRRCCLAVTQRARCSTRSRTKGGARTRTSCDKPRSLSLVLPFALSLPLLCCLSRAASRPCALRSCPQTGANDRGRARRSRNARAPLWPTTLDAPGKGAPGTHGGRGSDDGTLLCFGKGVGKGGGKGGGCGKGSGRGKGGERRSGARTHVYEPSRSLKTVDPTRVHNQESRAVTLAKPCRP